MPRAVLHVGAPKSGTTFLQRGLWGRREELLEAGVTCPGSSAREMFRAAIEVREVADTWGLRAEDIAGTWQRLCDEARQHPGTTVLSHELLAAATEEQVETALASLEDLDLEVVVTERDLARQVLSEWQERIKNGSTQSFRRFQQGILKRLHEEPPSGLFWRYHDVPAVLQRWGRDLPADRVHVVVAPPSGADPTELWRRFGAAVGFDGAAIPPPESGGTANQTLGTAQIALLRRVNAALDGRIPQPHYARFVKRQFSQGLLAEHRSPRPACPADLAEALRDVAEGWCRAISSAGYQVHGDLAELLPRVPEEGAPAPDDVEPQDVVELSAAVVADLLVERRAAAQRRARPAPPPPTRGVRLRRRARAARARVAAALRRR